MFGNYKSWRTWVVEVLLKKKKKDLRFKKKKGFTHQHQIFSAIYIDFHKDECEISIYNSLGQVW